MAFVPRDAAELAAQGCTYVLLDEVPMAVMCDPAAQATVRGGGKLACARSGVGDALSLRPDGVELRRRKLELLVTVARGVWG